MAKEKVKAENMVLLLTAEFPIGEMNLVDILSGIQNAIEELQGYGEVKSAKLIVPKNEMDLV